SALYFGSDLGHREFPVPATPARQVKLSPNDIVIIGECQRAVFEQLRSADCTKVMHNQNPYYMLSYGFDSAQRLNDYPLTHIIVPSNFAKKRLLDIGVTRPIRVVRPYLPEYFRPAAKRLQIAFSPNKRPQESAFIIAAFKSRYPEFAEIAW